MLLPPPPPDAEVAAVAALNKEWLGEDAEVAAVAALNKEWLGEGPASSDFLDGLGVLVRNFDGQSDPAKLWIACVRGWCANMLNSTNFLSASLISRLRPWVWNWDGAGVVYQRQVVRDGILCGYAGDGDTWNKIDGGCYDQTRPGAWDYHYKPDEFKTLIDRQDPSAHNEIVLRATFVNARVPEAIAAFFFPNGGDENLARNAHFAFTQEFPHARVPLARYDKGSATAPFSLVST